MKIASYLSRSLKFNSDLKSSERGQSKKLYPNSRNKYHLVIEKYHSKFHWFGILLKFSGDNSKQFFKLIKLKKVDWKKFHKINQKINLSRFDLCYLRPNDFSDNTFSDNTKLLDEFLSQSSVP